MRDITSNPEWEKAYQYEIPVLAKLLSDGTEVSFFLYLGFFLVLSFKKEEEEEAILVPGNLYY